MGGIYSKVTVINIVSNAMINIKGFLKLPDPTNIIDRNLPSLCGDKNTGP